MLSGNVSVKVDIISQGMNMKIPVGYLTRRNGILLMRKMVFHNKRIDMIVVCLLVSFLILFAGGYNYISLKHTLTKQGISLHRRYCCLEIIK